MARRHEVCRSRSLGHCNVDGMILPMGWTFDGRVHGRRLRAGDEQEKSGSRRTNVRTSIWLPSGVAFSESQSESHPESQFKSYMIQTPSANGQRIPHICSIYCLLTSRDGMADDSHCNTSQGVLMLPPVYESLVKPIPSRKDRPTDAACHARMIGGAGFVCYINMVCCCEDAVSACLGIDKPRVWESIGGRSWKSASRHRMRSASSVYSSPPGPLCFALRNFHHAKPVLISVVVGPTSSLCVPILGRRFDVAHL